MKVRRPLTATARWLLHRGLDLASSELMLRISMQLSELEARRSLLQRSIISGLGSALGACPRGELAERYEELSELQRSAERLQRQLDALRERS